MNVVVGIFLLMHALVHGLYFAQAFKFFKLQPEMTWPSGSWAFSRLLGESANGTLAGVACLAAGVLFVGGAIGLFASQAWWVPVTVGAAIFSCLIWLMFFDGSFSALANKGLYALLINAVILILILVFNWPSVA